MFSKNKIRQSFLVYRRSDGRLCSAFVCCRIQCKSSSTYFVFDCPTAQGLASGCPLSTLSSVHCPDSLKFPRDIFLPHTEYSLYHPTGTNFRVPLHSFLHIIHLSSFFSLSLFRRRPREGRSSQVASQKQILLMLPSSNLGHGREHSSLSVCPSVYYLYES